MVAELDTAQCAATFLYGITYVSTVSVIATTVAVLPCQHRRLLYSWPSPLRACLSEA